MGLFDNSNKRSADVIYEQQVQQYLEPKDGRVHVLMITSFAKFASNVFSVETQYTNQINLIVNRMQDDGYEIEDIDFNPLKSDGALGIKDGFSTLIRYK